MTAEMMDGHSDPERCDNRNYPKHKQYTTNKPE